jgi:hypothetical protein
MTAPTATTIDRQARRWLRLEGLAVLVAGAVAFGGVGGDFLWFLPALLLPDVAIAGYLAGPRVGAFVYNLVHNWGLGLAAAAAGLGLGIVPLTLAGTLLIAHSGMDRAAGYGLKLASGFGDTHLGRIGKAARGGATAASTAGSPAAESASNLVAG